MQFCSLGSVCHCAALLQRNRLVHQSYPFDWVFSSTEMVCHCIEDDFKTFLDRKRYVSKGSSRCGHKDYNDDLFRHHNPLLNEATYDYFNRCVNRFRNFLHSSNKKVFVLFCSNPDITPVLKLSRLLAKHTTNFSLLVIRHYPNSLYNSNHESVVGNIHFLSIYTKTQSNGLTFGDSDDDIHVDRCLTLWYHRAFLHHCIHTKTPSFTQWITQAFFP
jgi:Putative papain-like cysteine peptidase (DUF1796)